MNTTVDAPYRRHTPMISMHLHVELDAVQAPMVDVTPGRGERIPDTGRVMLTFGEGGSGDVTVTLAASAWDLRHLSAMLDEAALEIERQWADHAEAVLTESIKAVAS